MSGRFLGKVALVAGGTGGLGRAVTLAFLEEGARVLVTYRREAEYDLLKPAAGDKRAALVGRSIDVTDEGAVKQLVEDIVNPASGNGGKLDFLVNAVGGYAGGVSLWELESETLNTMLALNLRSGYALCRAAVPVMLAQKSGAIVNVVAKAALDHAAGASAYAASKAASLAMMDSLAADLKATGVRANSVLPSIIDTAQNRKAMPGADFARWPKPEEIARVVLFLCSDDARVVHGAALPVYGDS